MFISLFPALGCFTEFINAKICYLGKLQSVLSIFTKTLYYLTIIPTLSIDSTFKLLVYLCPPDNDTQYANDIIRQYSIRYNDSTPTVATNAQF